MNVTTFGQAQPSEPSEPNQPNQRSEPLKESKFDKYADEKKFEDELLNYLTGNKIKINHLCYQYDSNDQAKEITYNIDFCKIATYISFVKSMVQKNPSYKAYIKDHAEKLYVGQLKNTVCSALHNTNYDLDRKTKLDICELRGEEAMAIFRGEY